MSSGDVKIIDLDVYEPTDAEILSWHDMMIAPDQLAWEYDANWAHEPTTAQKEIEEFRERRARQRGENHPFWAVLDGKVVGMVGLNRFTCRERRHCGEIGIGVLAAFTRRGIATRLLGAAIQKARQLGLKRVEADCFDDNAACIALLRKFGFADEGVRLGALCKDGRLMNQRFFGLVL